MESHPKPHIAFLFAIIYALCQQNTILYLILVVNQLLTMPVKLEDQRGSETYPHPAVSLPHFHKMSLFTPDSS